MSIFVDDDILNQAEEVRKEQISEIVLNRIIKDNTITDLLGQEIKMGDTVVRLFGYTKPELYVVGKINYKGELVLIKRATSESCYYPLSRGVGDNYIEASPKSVLLANEKTLNIMKNINNI